MTKKLLVIILTLSLIATIFVSCGKKSDDETTTTAESSTEATTASDDSTGSDDESTTSEKSTTGVKVIDYDDVTVDKAEDIEIDEVEYAYYYCSRYFQQQQTTEYYSSYVSSGLMQLYTAPSEQEYTGTIEGFPEGETPTWSDYLEYATMEHIKYVYNCKAIAAAMGLELNDEQKADLEDEIEDVEDNAKENDLSADEYLTESFGVDMTLDDYRSFLEDEYIAEAYQDAKEAEYKEDFLADKDKMNSYFEEYKDEYTTVTFVYVNLTPTSSTDDDGNTIVDEDSYKQMQTYAKQLAKAKDQDELESMLEKLQKKDESLAGSAIQTMEEQTIAQVAGNSSSDNELYNWFSSEDTAANSTYIDEEDTAVNVLMMLEPAHTAKSYKTYTSRNILIQFPDDSDADVPELDTSKAGDVTIDNEVDASTAANKAGYAEIQDILQEYLDGEHTEEAFAALAEKYSEDTGSNTDGGLYEDIPEGQFVDAYDDWCLKKGRKAGDVGIVEYDVDGGSYEGYHLIYFVSSDTVNYKQVMAAAYATDAYSDYVGTWSSGDALVNISVKDSIVQKSVEFVDEKCVDVASETTTASEE